VNSGTRTRAGAVSMLKCISRFSPEDLGVCRAKGEEKACAARRDVKRGMAWCSVKHVQGARHGAVVAVAPEDDGRVACHCATPWRGVAKEW